MSRTSYAPAYCDDFPYFGAGGVGAGSAGNGG
jgi:hypothetical protein